MTKKEQNEQTASQPQADAVHPDVHPERVAPSGMQEPNTGGPIEQNPGNETVVAGGMNLLGANAAQQGTGQPGSGEQDADALSEQDYVYSHEQALALPVVDKGTPVKAPSDAEAKKLHKKQLDKAQADVRLANESAADDKKQTIPADVPYRQPVVAFKHPQTRQTMQVVKTKDGLAAMAAKEAETA